MDTATLSQSHPHTHRIHSLHSNHGIRPLSQQEEDDLVHDYLHEQRSSQLGRESVMLSSLPFDLSDDASSSPASTRSFSQPQHTSNAPTETSPQTATSHNAESNGSTHSHNAHRDTEFYILDPLPQSHPQSVHGDSTPEDSNSATDTPATQVSETEEDISQFLSFQRDSQLERESVQLILDDESKDLLSNAHHTSLVDNTTHDLEQGKSQRKATVLNGGRGQARDLAIIGNHHRHDHSHSHSNGGNEAATSTAFLDSETEEETDADAEGSRVPDVSTEVETADANGHDHELEHGTSEEASIVSPAEEEVISPGGIVRERDRALRALEGQ